MSVPALMIIDMQRAIDDPSWGSDRNNPEAESNIAALLAQWRASRWPVVHVRHVSSDPGSAHGPDQPAASFKPGLEPQDGEMVIEKSTNSAFIRTGLDDRLRTAGINHLVITGVFTNNSVEATARMAGNLGYQTWVVADATAAFGRPGRGGRRWSADEVHELSLSNLSGEYATIVDTAEVSTLFGTDPAGSTTETANPESGLTVRRLEPSDAESYRSLMLQAYAAHPDAFISTREERASLPLSWWESRVSADESISEVVIGAFEDGILRGVAGVSFERRPKVKHKSTLFGMYVSPELRARGVGQALVEAVIDVASTRPEILVMQLTVSEGNLAAQRLYEACGFSRFGVEPYAVRVGDTFVAKVHMWRWLRGSAAPHAPAQTEG